MTIHLVGGDWIRAQVSGVAFCPFNLYVAFSFHLPYSNFLDTLSSPGFWHETTF